MANAGPEAQVNSKHYCRLNYLKDLDCKDTSSLMEITLLTCSTEPRDSSVETFHSHERIIINHKNQNSNFFIIMEIAKAVES